MSSLAGALIPPESSTDIKPLDDSEDLFGADHDVPVTNPLEYEEDDVTPPQILEIKEAAVSFPNLPQPKSSDGNHWVLRVPNFVKIDSKPFHPDTYIGPEQEDEETQQSEARERSMTIKLKVENTLRWRWTKDQFGNDVRQSNSRIIRWSDGTMSLRLGKELFDVNQSVDTSAATPRPSQSQTPASTRSQGLTYLVAQHKRSQVLQAEALVTGYMTLTPTGMQSETHRMLVRAVGQKHNKIARLRLTAEPTVDPEKEKLELMKQSAKKSRRQPRERDIFDSSSSRKRRRYQENDWSDDEMDDVFGAGSDDEDHDTVTPRSQHKSRPKPGAEADYQEDGFVVADSDSDGGASSKRKKHREDAEPDDLEKMEAQLEEAAEKRKRTQDKKPKPEADSQDEDAEGDEAMDVESEEEDEEAFQVRRRRQAVYEDEEEEQ